MLAYDTDVLRTGASVASEVASTVSASGTAVSGASVSAGAFGQVGKAGALAATLAEVRRQQVQHATRVAANAATAGARLRTAAYLGDQLSITTTSVAAGVGVAAA